MPRRRLVAERLEARWLLSADAALDAVAAEGESTPVPDFQLIDQNVNSATHSQSVSPRDYLQQVSGWYFTFAT